MKRSVRGVALVAAIASVLAACSGSPAASGGLKNVSVQLSGSPRPSSPARSRPRGSATTPRRG